MIDTKCTLIAGPPGDFRDAWRFVDYSGMTHDPDLGAYRQTQA